MTGIVYDIPFIYELYDNCQGVAVRSDPAHDWTAGRTNDPGMLLLTAVSLLTHRNTVGFGASDGQVQWVDLWSGYAHAVEPDPPPGVIWPIDNVPLEEVNVSNIVFSLRAGPNDLLIVAWSERELLVRQPGLQALVSALACRDNLTSVSFYCSQNEILGVEAGL